MSALNKKSFLTYLKEGGIYVVLLVLLAIIIFQDPTFLSLLNLSNILTQSSVRIIIALGVAGLIVTQGTDLSAGRQVGLAAVVAATLLQSMDNANKVFPEMATMPIALVILIVCAIGAVIGLINGLIIAYLNVTPFITTLGTMIIVYGINSLYYDLSGRHQFLVLTVASLPLLRLCRAGEFPSLLHHLLRVDCGGVRLGVVEQNPLR